VIGPDEYHDDVDDNAFTNVMARWNIARALEALDLLHARWPDQAAALREKLALGDPGNPLWQRDLTLGENKLGDLFVAAGRWDEALSAYRKGLAIRTRLAESDPGSARRHDLAFSYGGRPGAGRRQQFEQALASFRSAIAIIELAAGDPAMSSGRAPL
jgi:tetratricopeptide (TPR) repeat protein